MPTAGGQRRTDAGGSSCDGGRRAGETESTSRASGMGHCGNGADNSSSCAKPTQDVSGPPVVVNRENGGLLDESRRTLSTGPAARAWYSNHFLHGCNQHPPCMSPARAHNAHACAFCCHAPPMVEVLAAGSCRLTPRNTCRLHDPQRACKPTLDRLRKKSTSLGNRTPAAPTQRSSHRAPHRNGDDDHRRQRDL